MPTDKDKVETPEPAPSVRDSLVAALKAQNEASEDNTPDDEQREPEPLDDDLVDDPAAEGVLDDKSDKTKQLKKADGKKVEKTEETEDEPEDTPDEETADAVDLKDGNVERKGKSTVVAAPENWKNEEDWDKLPSKIRQRIIKREAEVSAGIKQYADKARAFDEYEISVGPRRQKIASLGVTPQQVVHVALEWMDTLATTDPVLKDRAFRELARRYNYNISALAGNNQGDADHSGDPEVPDHIRNYVSGLETKIAQMEQSFGQVTNTFEQQQLQTAKNHLDQWASDKPHFAAVQTLMGQLINAGSAPFKDGRVDMDALYDMAVHATPDVRKLVQLEQAQKAKIEREAKLKKEKQAKQLALNKARAANGSLKPGAPSSPALNGGKPGTSVRDTIRASLRELTD